ncbi:MATE family efflux transporter [Burkholderia cepacia]|uniref:MATE family efflux transporter n=1 Tax=Burkholderia cepacia TaxID=292 RepID=UPI00234973EE|nr:MATE family efflux transporter [Burkholderia cepacia]MDC6098217.1 MATE family efflux transporter [Burkholderia cepacia]
MDQTSNKPDAGALRRARILGGPLFRTLLSLGVTTMAVLIAQTFVGVLETWYVSFLGTDSLVGVSLVFPISMLMTMMSNGGIGGGVASAVARAIGGGKRRDADALVLHAVVVAVALGCLFTILAWCYGPELYAALGGRGPGLAAAVTYSNYVFAGAIPVWIVNLLCAALRGSGNVKIPAITTFAGALVLIPLSPLLIFGIGPVPGLGIAGAGIAVSLYYSIAAVALLIYMARGHAGLVLTRTPLNLRFFSDILRVGALSSIGALQLNLMVVLLTAVVGRFGQAALAGYGIASRLDYVLIPLLFGLGTAVLTVVGTCMGAGDIARARRATWLGIAMGAGFTQIIGLVVAIHPPVWLGLFTHDTATTHFGGLYLRTIAPLYGLVGVSFILSFAAQGIGRPFWTILGGTARLFIAAGGGWLAVNQLGGGMGTLSAFVAAGTIGSALICAATMVPKRIWTRVEV